MFVCILYLADQRWSKCALPCAHTSAGVCLWIGLAGQAPGLCSYNALCVLRVVAARLRGWLGVHTYVYVCVIVHSTGGVGGVPDRCPCCRCERDARMCSNRG